MIVPMHVTSWTILVFVGSVSQLTDLITNTSMASLSSTYVSTSLVPRPPRPAFVACSTESQSK